MHEVSRSLVWTVRLDGEKGAVCFQVDDAPVGAGVVVEMGVGACAAQVFHTVIGVLPGYNDLAGWGRLRRSGISHLRRS